MKKRITNMDILANILTSSAQLRLAQRSLAFIQYLVCLRLAQRCSAFIEYLACLRMAFIKHLVCLGLAQSSSAFIMYLVCLRLAQRSSAFIRYLVCLRLGVLVLYIKFEGAKNIHVLI